jgi:hypothetical protein
MYGRTAHGSAVEAIGSVGVGIAMDDGIGGGALRSGWYAVAACAEWALAPRSMSSAEARKAAAERNMAET